MGFSLLLDEMTEASLAEYCRTLGHDVERVVTVSELGSGSDDDEIVAYAEREGRILVTYDDDFLAGHDALDRIGVLFQANDRTARSRRQTSSTPSQATSTTGRSSRARRRFT